MGINQLEANFKAYEMLGYSKKEYSKLNLTNTEANSDNVALEKDMLTLF